MTTVLRIVLDEAPAVRMSTEGRFALETIRALVAWAPSGCVVDAVTPALEDAERETLERVVPGLRHILASRLGRRELVAAWQHGVTVVPGEGIIHSPTEVAPLRRHDRAADPGSQVSLTLHRLPEWAAPLPGSPRGARTTGAMLRRAERYADAVLVPSHALADALIDSLADRVRVVPGGIRSDLVTPDDDAERRERWALPAGYLMTAASPHSGLHRVLVAADFLDVPVVLVGGTPEPGRPDPVGDAIEAAGAARRVTRIDAPTGADLAALYAGAAAVVDPRAQVGFGHAVLEAMSLGRPTVVADTPALLELTADSAEVVAASDPDPAALSTGIARVLGDTGRTARLGILGRDRSRAFTWQDTADKIWQLHADL